MQLCETCSHIAVICCLSELADITMSSSECCSYVSCKYIVSGSLFFTHPTLSSVFHFSSPPSSFLKGTIIYKFVNYYFLVLHNTIVDLKVSTQSLLLYLLSIHCLSINNILYSATYSSKPACRMGTSEALKKGASGVTKGAMM